MFLKYEAVAQAARSVPAVSLALARIHRITVLRMGQDLRICIRCRSAATPKLFF